MNNVELRFEYPWLLLLLLPALALVLVPWLRIPAAGRRGAAKILPAVFPMSSAPPPRMRDVSPVMRAQRVSSPEIAAALSRGALSPASRADFVQYPRILSAALGRLSR